jgi:hypothetical protein
MIRVSAVELELGLEWHTIGQPMDETLLNAVTWRINIVIQEFQHEIVAGVSDGEILCKDLIETIVLSQLGRCVQLKEILEGLQLHVKKVGIRHRLPDGCKVYSVIDNL